MIRQLLIVATMLVATINVQAADETWYGYYKGNELLGYFGTGGWGGREHKAITLHGDDAICQGKKIKAVRFRVQGTAYMDDFYVWLSSSLPTPGDSADIIRVAVDKESLVDHEFNTVMLPTPYEFEGKDVTIGYSFTIDDASAPEARYPSYTTVDGIAPEGALYDWAPTVMSGWQSYGDRMGKLAVQVLLEGDFSQAAATAADFGDYKVLAGEQIAISLPVSNYGLQPIESIDYVVTTSGVASAEQHYQLAEPFDVFTGTTAVDLSLAADEETAKAEKVITITRVNGKPNGISDGRQSAHGTLTTIAERSKQRVVMEEYTGTWCGWCPRGTVGIEKLRADYGDEFIAISIHTKQNDPMEIMAYSDITSTIYSYPVARLNRDREGDPYAGSASQVYGVKDDYDYERSILSEAAVETTATWANADSTRIKVDTDVTFQLNASEAPYALAYVLLADGLSGEGSVWNQTNYFYYFTDSPDYAEGTQMGTDFAYYLGAGTESIAGAVYNDVAIAGYGVTGGLANSISAPLVAGDVQHHSYTISIASNGLVQDKQKLRVVALLLNTESGKIVNAAECPLPAATDGIEQTEAYPQPEGKEAEAAAVYDLNGRRLPQLQRGLNIVRRADGSVVKVAH